MVAVFYYYVIFTVDRCTLTLNSDTIIIIITIISVALLWMHAGIW